MKYSVEQIDDIICAYLPEETGFAKPVITAMNYAFKAGGKRVRPMLMKMTYDMFHDVAGQKVLETFMAAIEMIHTYSLIHDDLPALDNDELRRGKPTVHVKYGEDIAILAGDGLLNYAFEIVAKTLLRSPGSVPIERAFAMLCEKPGISGMIGGQTLDVVMTGKPVNDMQLDYIYLNKTAALLACAVTIGAILGGASEAQVSLLNDAAVSVGMAFQVQDDILDITSTEEVLGKPINSDTRNEKTTYVTIHGLEAARNYVVEQTERAEQLIAQLDVDNAMAKKDLLDFIHTLISREK